jgi:hypothetical protein
MSHLPAAVLGLVVCDALILYVIRRMRQGHRLVGRGAAVVEGAGEDAWREPAHRLEGRHEGGAEGTLRRAVIAPQRRKPLVEARYEGNIEPL